MNVRAFVRLISLVAAAGALTLFARAQTSGGSVPGRSVSPGAVNTTNNSLINVGQSAVGNARGGIYGMKSGAIPVLRRLLEQRLPDMDGDGDVDLDDQYIFALCMAGPQVTTPPRGCTQEQFNLADVQHDSDVDLADFKSVGIAFEIP